MAEEFDWSPFEGDRWTAENIGDQIVGTITKLEIGHGQRGDFPIVHLTTKEGERQVSASIDLARKLADERPQVGDQIAVKLTELKNTGQPSPMKVFALKVKRAEPALPVEVDDEEEAFEVAKVQWDDMIPPRDFWQGSEFERIVDGCEQATDLFVRAVDQHSEAEAAYLRAYHAVGVAVVDDAKSKADADRIAEHAAIEEHIAEKWAAGAVASAKALRDTRLAVLSAAQSHLRATERQT